MNKNITEQKELRSKVFELIEPSKNNKASALVDNAVILIIIIAVISTILESVESISSRHHLLFNSIEIFCVVFFTIEYLLRLWTAPCKNSKISPFKNRTNYAISFFGLIDFFAIIPFYLSLIYPFLDLRIIRIIRLLRILKISHYNSALQDLWEAIYDERKSFISAIYILSITTLLCSSLIYFAEYQYQPEKFSSIPESLWWSLITLTTVGYGDVFPITAIGKIVGVTTALMGVSTVALLTGIVANSFSMQQARKRAIFEAAILRALEDGVISSEEEDLLKRMRDEFNLTKEHAHAIYEKASQEYRQRHKL